MDQNQETNADSSGEPDVPMDRAAAALARLQASGVDATQLAALKEKLGKLRKSDEQTHSGSEMPSADAETPTPADSRGQGRVRTGADVNWSEYDLNFNVRHLYPKAVQRDTPDGPKWVSMVVDFLSSVKHFDKAGEFVNAPGSVDKTATEPKNLAEYLKDKCNGPDQWRIAAVMPGPNGQCGILLEREVPIVLPDPIRLKKEEEVEVPSDKELQLVEEAALNFMDEQKDVDKEVQVEDDTTDPSVTLRPIEKGSAEDAAIRATLEDGVLPAVQSRIRVQKALERNREMTIEAPQGKGLQPEPVTVNPPEVGMDVVVPAAGVSAAADILRALTDEGFRKSLPQE